MPDAELIDRVVATTGVTPGEATRLIDDVLAWYREPVEAFVRRRHAELRLTGVRNPRAFAAILDELAGRTFAAPALSERQVRRIIYG